MERYSLRDAQAHLQDLIEEAEQGKTVVILDEQNRAVQLIPISTAKSRARQEAFVGVCT